MLPSAVTAYNISYHRGIGCSPIEMVKGELINEIDVWNNVK
jgi:hypothetical protein